MSRFAAMWLFVLAQQPRLDAQLVISELVASNQTGAIDEFGDHSDWIELYNHSAQSINLEGWQLSDDSEELAKFQFPEYEFQPHTFLRVWCSGLSPKQRSHEFHVPFKLNASGEQVFLTPPNETIPVSIADFRSSGIPVDQAWGLPAAAFPEILLPHQATGRFLIPHSPLPDTKWTTRDYDDTQWHVGRSPFGFDQKRYPTVANEIRTDLGMLVPAGCNHAYFRFAFAWNPSDDRQAPTLQLEYKDGFAAYLNGQLVARKGVLKGTTWDPRLQRFTANDTPTSPSTARVDNIAPYLQPGLNYLAIHVMFGEEKSIDMFLAPKINALPAATYAGGHVVLPKPTPGEPNVRSGSETETGQPPNQQKPTIADLFTSNPSLRRFQSNLPIVFIETFGRQISPAHRIPISMAFFEPGTDQQTRLNKPPSFTSPAEIKHRGSSTLYRPKKAFRFELKHDDGQDRSASLLGLPADEDWILYGPYNYDRSMIRNALIYELSNQMGYYAPRTRFVEAFVNDDDTGASLSDYVGLYLLVENIKLSPHRVAIAPQAPSPGPSADLAGDYVFKIDRLGPGESGFYAGHQTLAFVDPSEREITAPQQRWLTDYLDDFLAALAGPDFRDPTKGYQAFIDVDNWVDQRLIQEFVRNPDAYGLSTFLTKLRGEKLRLGPVWDFDRAMRTNTDEEYVGRKMRPKEWVDEDGYNWGKLLMDDPAFKARFRQRGREWLNGVWSKENVSQVIDRLAGEIAEAQERNHRRWGILSPQSWRVEIEQLKAWYAERHKWLEGKLAPPPAATLAKDPLTLPNVLTLTSGEPGGKIFYTVDGSSPITNSEALASNARVYTTPIQLKEPQTITAAVRRQGAWSEEIRISVTDKKRTLAITEIMYKPREGSELEFIEILNYGKDPVSLAGVTITGAVDFEFDEGFVSTIGPGDYVFVVRYPDRFEETYGIDSAKVAGAFDWKLSNTSGRLQIRGPHGETINDVFYTDAWYPSTDGEGYSLCLDPEAAAHPLRWRDPRSWHPSAVVGGTPGR